MNDDTLIETVIDAALKKLGQANFSDFQMYNERDEWINVCKRNLIFCVGTLRRLSPGKLSRLELPLALEDELERIITNNGNSSSSSGSPFSPSKAINPSGLVDPSKRFASYTLNITSQQKDALRNCWSNFLAAKDSHAKFSQTFYPLFFSVNPAGQRLFKNRDMQSQARVLMAMLGWIMKNLDNTHLIVPVIAQLGGRHELYGVVLNDYKAFANSIATALRKIMGEENFSDEMFKTWETCITQMGELMLRAAKEVRLGHRGPLLRQRTNENWVTTWVNLTLDTLYLFDDESFTKLRAPYSLRGVEGVTYVDQDIAARASNAQPLIFELVSTNPPFTIQLAAETKEEFERWVGELDWRIRAIQRVYSSSGDSDSDSDVEQGSQQHKSLAKRTQKTKKRVAKKKAATKAIESVSNANITLTEAQKGAIKKSWKLLCEKDFPSPSGSTEKALARFYDAFYPKFFEINPVARRLFQEEGMMAQIQALVRMLSTIVKLLDVPDDLHKILSRLGGRHEIYGVESQDYMAFANAITDTLRTVLLDECTNEMQESWFKVMMEISVVMQTAGKALKTTAVEGVIYRKVRRSEWKRSLISLNLDSLSIYKDTKLGKLKASIPLVAVSNLDVISADSDPTEHGFVLETSLLQLSYISFCCETKEESARWVDELNWRIRAIARAYNTTPDSDSDQSVLSHSSSATELRKHFSKSAKKLSQRSNTFRTHTDQ